MSRFTIALVLASLCALGCEDNSGGKGGLTMLEPTDRPDAALQPEPEPFEPSGEDEEPEPQEPQQPQEPEEPQEPQEPQAEPNRLISESAAAHNIFHNAQLELSLRYVDGSGAAITAGGIQLQLLDEAGLDRTMEGVAGSTLRRARLSTDAAGRATIQLDAGEQNTTLRIHASAPDAQPIAWLVHVANNPEGDLTVTVTYAGRYAEGIERVELGLVDGFCVGVDAAAPFAHRLPAIQPFAGEGRSVGRGLPHGERYAVLAEGKNLAGTTLAAGCVDVELIGGAMAEGEVELLDRPLEFKGVYEVEHQLDLTAMLEQAEGDLGGALDVLELLGAIGGGLGEQPFPRGDGIIQIVCERGDIAEAECLMLRQIGAPLLEQIIADVAPPEALEVLDVIGDVYRILSELTVYGEMEFAASRPNAEGLLPGNESRWHGLRMIWRRGCPFDAPEDCVRDISLLDAGIGPRTLVGAFDARLDAEDADLLHIGRHDFDLHMGRLAMALLETWVLPAALGVEGPVTLEQLFATIIDCEQVNLALPPMDANSGVCEATIIQPAAAAVAEQLQGMGAGFQAFTFEGTVRVADALPDLRVDRLEEGVWQGAFGDAEDLAGAAGTFAGCRRGECAEALPDAE